MGNEPPGTLGVPADNVRNAIASSKEKNDPILLLCCDTFFLEGNEFYSSMIFDGSAGSEEMAD